MCKAMTVPSRFDARLCPLLQGLSAEEQEERIRNDPIIAACIAALEGRTDASPQTAEQLAAYDERHLCAEARARETAPHSAELFTAA